MDRSLGDLISSNQAPKIKLDFTNAMADARSKATRKDVMRENQGAAPISIISRITSWTAIVLKCSTARSWLEPEIYVQAPYAPGDFSWQHHDAKRSMCRGYGGWKRYSLARMFLLASCRGTSRHMITCLLGNFGYFMKVASSLSFSLVHRPT